MTDVRLRQLEREAATTGDPELAVRLLAERARAGLVSPAALLLAAYCDHPAARALLGAKAPPTARSSKEWFLGLTQFGKPVSVQAAVAAGGLVLPAWSRLGLWIAVEALCAAVDWLQCPCEKHRRRAAEVGRLAAPPAPSSVRAASNIALSASRRDRSRSEQSAASRLAARDAAAAAWNLREVTCGRPVEEVAAALAACGFDGLPTLSAVRSLVAAQVGAGALDPEAAPRRARGRSVARWFPARPGAM